jgi:hypothetical protein
MPIKDNISKRRQSEGYVFPERGCIRIESESFKVTKTGYTKIKRKKVTVSLFVNINYKPYYTYDISFDKESSRGITLKDTDFNVIYDAAEYSGFNSIESVMTFHSLSIKAHAIAMELISNRINAHRLFSDRREVSNA